MDLFLNIVIEWHADEVKNSGGEMWMTDVREMWLKNSFIIL